MKAPNTTQALTRLRSELRRKHLGPVPSTRVHKDRKKDHSRLLCRAPRQKGQAD